MSALMPVGNRVIVKRTVVEAQTPGGIFIPETAKEKPAEGVIVSQTSPGFNAGLAEGARVLFSKYAGVEVRVDGEDFLILNIDDVLAVVS